MFHFLAFFCLTSFNIQPAVDSIKTTGVHSFKVDQYENLYLLRFDELIKMDPGQKVVYHYSNPLLGEIYSISVLDPLEPLLFYRDQYRITTLDNRLNVKNELYFPDFKLNDVQLVSQSDANHIWTYDQSTDKLYRIQINNGKITNQSLNISQLLQHENQAVQLECSVDFLFLLIKGTGIMVFDANASFVELIPIADIDQMSLQGDIIYYRKLGSVFQYNLQNSQHKEILKNIQERDVMDVWKNKLYILSKSWLKVYDVKS